MESSTVHHLTEAFEGHAQQTENGVEYWLARDLQHFLGYSKWENFERVIRRAQGILLHQHRPGTILSCTRRVDIGSGAQRNLVDYQIDRRAMELIKELAASHKLTNKYSIRNESVVLQLLDKYCNRKSITFVYQYRIGKSVYDCMIGGCLLIEFDEPHHDSRRQRKTDSLKDQLASANGFRLLRCSLETDIVDLILFVDENFPQGKRQSGEKVDYAPSLASIGGFVLPRSISTKADSALFGKSARAMKAQWKVPANRLLNDFAPTIILKAKDFATEITIHNARAHDMSTEPQISREHVTNNHAVRDTLLNRGIRPESLSPVEDVKKVERRLTSDEKKALKKSETFEGA